VPTVLCIEDEPELRADLVEELRDAGYETHEAGNGAQGLSAILRLRPDLVICDVTMPDMNGIDMFHLVRREHPSCAPTRFIFLSALEDVASRIEDGFHLDACLTKPIDYATILNLVEMQVGAGEDIVQPANWAARTER
jgi:CheY-like chemotaxis protein